MNRTELIAETAITLLAERGMRGLTHRAVDEAAGLPPGSTSNLARSRAALLELTLARLTSLEEEALSEVFVLPAGDLVETMAKGLQAQLADRRRTLARYELALEATRRPELREIYDRAGARFRDPAVALLAAAGFPDPVRQARQVVSYCEGVLFDAIVGAGAEPSVEDLRAGLAELLTGLAVRRPDPASETAEPPPPSQEKG
ncbi:TetR/AcrR family transcriptional regulator [Nonomuraea sp. NPDC050310]|uniref:TetR/AcrR family transcriptional regulator n=1 Tax=Nonomuraea sp. NPDC050310 TaxID=3154935 RepID=UPI0033D3E75D